MDLELVLRLEQKVDQLLERKNDLEAECLRLRAENQELVAERERVRAELDRILDKIERYGRESSG